MRGTNHKRWMVGALASAALLFTGCSNQAEKMADPSNSHIEPASEQGVGGSGPAVIAHKGHKGGHHDDGGTRVDAGTGGAGLQGSDSLGTMGEGVTGGELRQGNDASGHTPSGGVPAPVGH